MQFENDRNLGYGMLATKILGDPYLLNRSDYETEAAEHLRQSRSTLFQTWYLRRFFDKHELPAGFVRAVDDAIEACGYGYGNFRISERSERGRQYQNERCRQILRMRFGLSDGISRGFEEIGDQLPNRQTGKIGVTTERVRSLEGRALRMLRKYKSEEIKASLTDDTIRELFGLEPLS